MPFILKGENYYCPTGDWMHFTILSRATIRFYPLTPPMAQRMIRTFPSSDARNVLFYSNMQGMYINMFFLGGRHASQCAQYCHVTQQ